jgi:hypothetical protein
MTMLRAVFNQVPSESANSDTVDDSEDGSYEDRSCDEMSEAPDLSGTPAEQATELLRVIIDGRDVDRVGVAMRDLADVCTTHGSLYCLLLELGFCEAFAAVSTSVRGWTSPTIRYGIAILRKLLFMETKHVACEMEMHGLYQVLVRVCGVNWNVPRAPVLNDCIDCFWATARIDVGASALLQNDDFPRMLSCVNSNSEKRCPGAVKQLLLDLMQMLAVHEQLHPVFVEKGLVELVSGIMQDLRDDLDIQAKGIRILGKFLGSNAAKERMGYASFMAHLHNILTAPWLDIQTRAVVRDLICGIYQGIRPLIHVDDALLPAKRRRLRGGRSSAPPSAAAEAKAEAKDMPPAQFLCPITQEMMRDPVITADGHTYEREAIAKWLEAHNTSPLTNAQLDHTHLIPNHALRSLIMDSHIGKGQGDADQ